MNKTFSRERSSWKSMSSTLHPINTWTTFGWRKYGRICVKWRNSLKRERIGRRSPTTNCSLVKYICYSEGQQMIEPCCVLVELGYCPEHETSPKFLDRTLTEHSGLRHLTLVFFSSTLLRSSVGRSKSSSCHCTKWIWVVWKLALVNAIMRTNHLAHSSFSVASRIQKGT